MRAAARDTTSVGSTPVLHQDLLQQRLQVRRVSQALERILVLSSRHRRVSASSVPC